MFCQKVTAPKNDCIIMSTTSEHYNKVAKSIGRRSKRARLEEDPSAKAKCRINLAKRIVISRAVTTTPPRILDLCCGRFGDLHKYLACNASKIVGIDASSESILEAQSRAKTFVSMTTDIQLLCADILSEEARHFIEIHGPYDVVVANMCLNYFFDSANRLERFIHLAASRLVDGGFFIGSFADGQKIRTTPELRSAKSVFEFDTAQLSSSPFGYAYVFSLGDSVIGCKEYLASVPALVHCAKQCEFRNADIRWISDVWKFNTEEDPACDVSDVTDGEESLYKTFSFTFRDKKSSAPKVPSAAANSTFGDKVSCAPNSTETAAATAANSTFGDKVSCAANGTVPQQQQPILREIPIIPMPFALRGVGQESSTVTTATQQSPMFSSRRSGRAKPTSSFSPFVRKIAKTKLPNYTFESDAIDGVANATRSIAERLIIAARNAAMRCKKKTVSSEQVHDAIRTIIPHAAVSSVLAVAMDR